MIEQILKPFIRPIQKKIMRPIRRSAKLPKLIIRWLVSWGKTVLGTGLRSLDSYWRIGSYYVAKKLVVLVVLISLVIVYFGWIHPPKFVDKWFARTPVVTAAAAESNFAPEALADVDRYIAENDIVMNPLLFQGYPSIGCAPCTAKVAPGADPRSGRWAGKGKTECGLHLG